MAAFVLLFVQNIHIYRLYDLQKCKSINMIEVWILLENMLKIYLKKIKTKRWKKIFFFAQMFYTSLYLAYLAGMMVRMAHQYFISWPAYLKFASVSYFCLSFCIISLCRSSQFLYAI